MPWDKFEVAYSPNFQLLSWEKVKLRTKKELCDSKSKFDWLDSINEEPKF